MHVLLPQPTLATDMLLWTSYGGPSMCLDRGRRRAMLTEGFEADGVKGVWFVGLDKFAMC